MARRRRSPATTLISAFFYDVVRWITFPIWLPFVMLRGLARTGKRIRRSFGDAAAEGREARRNSE